MSVRLCVGATIVKKNSSLAPRIVSFDTAGPHLDIELDLSHVIAY